MHGNRSNDGKPDDQGGFVFGTMSRHGNKCSGSIYHVDTITFEVNRLDTGFFIPNGFAFNHDSTQVLIADSYLGKIYRYDYDAVHRVLANKSVFYDISGTGYSPDGMAIDVNNNVWNAEWDGGRLSQYTFEGVLIRHVEMPVKRPTSCAIGGQNGELLYVTSARDGLTDNDISLYPNSGSVFCINIRDV
jgi:sugar lactone lactonase YvrE